MNKKQILDEIKRTAAGNGGAPLGVRAFSTATGIKPAEWRGKHWVRWNDAIREAGLVPNVKQEAYDEGFLLLKLAELTRELGHFPTRDEIRMKGRIAGTYPSDGTFGRIGAKGELVLKVLAYCRSYEGLEDVARICEATQRQEDAPEADVQAEKEGADGFVYLLRYGRNYKIGKSNAFGRRERELAIQLPEKANTVHVIRTDDPTGIEDYWHRRFAEKRKNGEWFELNNRDVKAFRRRKFM